MSLFGLAMLLRDRDFPDDLGAAFRKLLPLYLLIVLVELINGGSLLSLAETAFNYLTLLALAPYAYALRKLGLGADILDRTIWATLALGAAISVAIALLRGDPRPGGLDMDALSYGYVLVVWLLFTFSSALERRRESVPLLVLSAAGLAVLLYAKTKIVIVCAMVGLLVVGAVWAGQRGRWRAFLTGLALCAVPFGLGFYFTAMRRVVVLGQGVEQYFETGTITVNSFGIRLSQVLAGWQAALERPVFGHGLAETRAAVGRYFGPSKETLNHWIIHNDYIVHMVAFGAFGLVFLLSYFVVAFMLMRGVADEAHRRAGMAMVATVPVLMTAFVVFNMSPMSGLVTVAMGVVLSAPPKLAGRVSA